MAQKKNKKVKGSEYRGKDVSKDGLVSPSAPSDTVTPSINIASYPHILSSILDYSSSSTLTTLLRCSKVMLKTVAPRIYRNLRITSQQLAGLLGIAWAPSKRGSTSGLPWESFSPFVKECLQGVEALHLLSFDSDIQYSNMPRGLFSRNETIVVYPDDGEFHALNNYRVLSLPTTFASLGASAVYIRISDSAIRLRSKDHGRIFVRDLPRNVKSLTFLIPLAYRLPCIPSCDGGAMTCDITVVLLPWCQQPEETALQATMLLRWTEGAQSDYSDGDDLYRHFVGSAYCGLSAGVRLILSPSQLEFPPPSYTSFGSWIRGLRLGAVFDPSETLSLVLADLRLLITLANDQSTKTDQAIEQAEADGADLTSPSMISLKMAVAEGKALSAQLVSTELSIRVEMEAVNEL